jgi:hypothetical protein
MTMDEQISSIESFGYTEPEARFLRLVARHGGYFVRRQYLRAVNCEPGKRAQCLIDKLLSRRHAFREVYRADRHLYRVHFKPIYEAVGDPDSRARRAHQASTIRLRLMALDFVLDHPEYWFLASQREKLAHIEGCGIDADVLPSRVYSSSNGSVTRRYFIDGFPIFLTAPDTGSIGFAYVDDGQLTTAAFYSYLRQHQPLFRSLTHTNLVFLTTRQERFEAARRVLTRAQERIAGYSEPTVDIDRLLSHFPHRLLAERRETRGLTKVQMDQLGEDLRTFAGPEFTRLCDLWRYGGPDSVRAELAARNRVGFAMRINFTACILHYDYELFGTLHAA